MNSTGNGSTLIRSMTSTISTTMMNQTNKTLSKIEMEAHEYFEQLNEHLEEEHSIGLVLIIYSTVRSGWKIMIMIVYLKVFSKLAV
jgi:hypothetical protein